MHHICLDIWLGMYYDSYWVHGLNVYEWLHLLFKASFLSLYEVKIFLRKREETKQKHETYIQNCNTDFWQIKENNQFS